MRIFIFLISSFLLFLPSVSNAFSCAAACNKTGSACKRQFFIGTKKIDYYSNFPIDRSNRCINEFIIAIHGNSRAVESRYFEVLNAAKSVGKANNVLIIAPFFKTDSDSPATNDYYWTRSGWKQGDNSVNSGAQISSFTIADTLLDTVITNKMFPSLAKISVTGLSAGGQYTNLYSLTTASPDKHMILPYQFLVLSPSSYDYLNDFRPNPTVDGLFEIPITCNDTTCVMKPVYEAEAGSCPASFNDYKYGLDKRNPYASQLSTTQEINQYINRNIFYFVGSLDNDPNDPELDISCPGKLEGPQRLKRAENFNVFLKQFFPTSTHSLGIVSGVGHNGAAMYNSDMVKSVLFK